jgi:hypothetical protein
MMPGLPSNLKSSRMAEVSTLFRRSANCNVMVYLSEEFGSHFANFWTRHETTAD